MARTPKGEKKDSDDNGDDGQAGEAVPSVRQCATEQVHLRLLLEEPEYALRRASIEDQAWRAAHVPFVARSGCTRIPVVVHVVHRTAAENVSQAQIDSQIAVLNDDFRKRNADIGSVPAAFAPLAADSRIEFALATTDPSGAATTGVTRTSTTVAGFSHDDTVKSAATGGANPWPSDRYLNMWVCKLAGGLLGYAQFPGGPATTDGVVITHTAFGNTGTAAAPFNKGRTAVHEIGHWLNLRHIWGDDGTGCAGSDFVDDTPNQGGANVGVPTFPKVSCGNGPNGDMFVNYMDYTDDAGMMMFTAGQVTRMHAALDGPRSAIGTSIPCVGVKLKFADEPSKLKFRDDGPKFKFRDDGPKLKFADDGGKLPVADATIKFRDDVKVPALDPIKAPAADGVIQPGPIVVQPVQPGPAGYAAPFILATPHHSRSWEQAAGGPDPTLAAYEAQLAQYEAALQVYAEAEAAGQLGEAEGGVVARIYAEYAQLGAEYQRLTGQG